MILFYIGRLAPFLADLLLLQDLREHTEGRRETPSGHLPSRILPLFFVQELRDRKRPPGARDVPRDLGAARSLRSPNIDVKSSILHERCLKKSPFGGPSLIWKSNVLTERGVKQVLLQNSKLEAKSDILIERGVKKAFVGVQALR